jgi:hypothetical protein
VTRAAERYEVFKPLLTIVGVGAVVHVQLLVAATAQPAAVPVPAVNPLLEHHPLSTYHHEDRHFPCAANLVRRLSGLCGYLRLYGILFTVTWAVISGASEQRGAST